ncbi:HEPN domain-containing protein [Thermodesulfobacterium sp. TA1]|uniref:HEPN domain-containing protein n=1 Tax=Thermodesulfobacterium geofontis TaxID=1295609 RepID=A0A7V5XH74_9BACT|nr:HEPN domain-containing protein [Thermodesulfobacterium sp. TA1]QER41220.1 HEPN domain-containing protein [Thermodesulfobacterium sp. TA1]
MLFEMCIREDKEFEKLDKDRISELTFYAVDIRYPDEYYIPSLEEAKESFEIAKQVKDFIFKKLNITEEDIK